MNSFMFDIGEKARKAARFIWHVRSELQRALIAEKATRKLTQQAIADQLGVNRSVINRQLMGEENLTLRSVAEIAWALGWEPVFELRKPPVSEGSNQVRQPPRTETVRAGRRIDVDKKKRDPISARGAGVSL